MTQEEYLLFLHETFTEMEELIRRKNTDYTAGGSAFANFECSMGWGVDPFTGLMIRMEDKIQRLKSFVKSGSLEVKGEGIDDALKDVIGYSVLGLGMQKEKKMSQS